MRAFGSRVSRAPLPDEMIEQILIRSEVSDLIRYRSVSKSWKYVISDPDFIKAHLEHSYRRDRENDKMGNRRIAMSVMRCSYWQYDADDILSVRRRRHLLGSSNGLVCVSPSRTKFLLINPETREVNKLEEPQIPREGYMIYGFGYDSSKDDYKVVLGFMKDSNHTCFLMFTLKSNVWEVIGEVNYTFISRVGVLYNGSLHWVVCHGSAYENPHCEAVLEIVDTKDKIKTEVVHRLKDLMHYIPNKKSLCLKKLVAHAPKFIGAPLYTPSLVSPHILKKTNETWQETSIVKSHKVPKVCLDSAISSEAGNLES
ncbi:unnamed protein product [Lactuca virosa]|uniref:F-box domain-containing protein n=1 Tax=Lactuca virosa TaxID=75947 RepID=A0AAU9M2Z2_9ASTR|nr:unnamed protein product [Lactuca virosa]